VVIEFPWGGRNLLPVNLPPGWRGVADGQPRTLPVLSDLSRVSWMSFFKQEWSPETSRASLPSGPTAR